MKNVLTIMIVSLLGFACTNIKHDPLNLVSSIQTQTADSSLSNIIITIKNESHYNAYFWIESNQIGFWRLQRKIGDAWVAVNQNAMEYHTVSPGGVKMISPGETLRDSFLLNQLGVFRICFPFTRDEEKTEKDTLSYEEFVAE